MSIKEQVENEVALVSTLAEKVKDKDALKNMTDAEIRELLAKLKTLRDRMVQRLEILENVLKKREESGEK